MVGFYSHQDSVLAYGRKGECGSALDLFYGDTTHHAGPIVVGAEKIVRSRPVGCQKDVFRLARLHYNFAALVVENLWIVDIGGGEERRRRELVGFLAVILQVQLKMDVLLEDQMIWNKFVIDHGEVDRLRLRERCGGDGEESGDDEKTCGAKLSSHLLCSPGRRRYRRDVERRERTQRSRAALAALDD